MKKVLLILSALSLQIAQCVDITITNATGIPSSELQASVMSSPDYQRRSANFDNDGKAHLQSPSAIYSLLVTQKLGTYSASAIANLAMIATSNNYTAFANPPMLLAS